MFNLNSINQHLSNLKFDLVAQALASSQTLIRSFRSLVVSIVSKIINDDALIKGQVNGPDNFKVKITDACIDLTNIKDEYSQSLKQASSKVVIPIIMPGQELGVDEVDLIANTRFSARMSNSAGILNKANIISFIRTPGAGIPVKEDMYGINSFPECVFAPVISNTYTPSYTAMYQNNQVPNINNMQAQRFFSPTGNTGFSRPIWFSVKPIVISSPNLAGSLGSDNVYLSEVNKLTDETFEALNCYYCQATEYQTLGGTSYVAIHSTLILYVIVQARYDDMEHPYSAEVAYKFYRDDMGGLGGNTSILYYSRRNAVNGIAEGKTTFDARYNISPSDVNFSLGSGKYDYSILNQILPLYTNLCQPGRYTGSMFREVLPSSVIDPVDVESLYNNGELTITKGLTQGEDGLSINDIHLSLGNLMGDLTGAMQDVIDDLSSSEYEE